MNSKPYLDKVVTAPHMPQPQGQIGFHTVKHFPDLSHTGIRTAFEKQIPNATASDGKLTEAYKAKAFKTTSLVQRELIKLNCKEDVFKTGHKQFIDKVLCDMESTKQSKNNRHMLLWTNSKNKLGFGESFNQTSRPQPNSFMDDNEQEPYYDANEFCESPTNIEHEDEKAGTNDAHHNKVTFSKLDSSQPLKSPSTHKQGRPYSTMTLFNSILDSTTPPVSPTKRFGTLAPLKH